MNPVSAGKESQIRFAVRQAYRDEGALDTHRKYPDPSTERLIAMDEENRISFEEMTSL